MSGVVEEQRKWVEGFFDDPGLVAGEFVPKMFFIDSTRKVRAAFFPNLSPDMETKKKMVWAMGCIAAAIVDLTEIVFVTDIWGATADKKDGTPWESGDYEYAVTHHTEDAPSVQEILNVTGMIVDGMVPWVASVPYYRRAHKDHDEIVPKDGWEVEVVDVDASPLFQAFQMAIENDKVIEKAKAALPDLYETLGEQQANLRCLLAAVKTIGQETHCPVAIGTEDDEEAKIIAESLGESFRVETYADGEWKDNSSE